MITVRARAVIVGLGLALLPAPGAFATESGTLADRCVAPVGVAWSRVALPNTMRAIRKGQPLTIVAIGSSSTEGAGASAPTRTYPARLAAELRRRLPDRVVTVINKGVGGETASQMLARFPTDVLPYRPHLVIWQMGSNAVLKGVDVATFERAIRDGVRRLKLAGIDIVLMDPQFAPRVVKQPLHRRILDVIRTVASDTKVAVFHRFAAMRYWLNAKTLRMEDVVARDQIHMTDFSYACVARLLADSLVAATDPPEELQSAGDTAIQAAAPN